MADQLTEIYNEALGMVSPGTDLPTLGYDEVDDPTREVAKRAFRYVCNSLCSFLNWSFLQEKRVLNSNSPTYTIRSGTPTQPDPLPADASQAQMEAFDKANNEYQENFFDPLYQYRWDIGEETLPGLQRISGVLIDSFDLINQNQIIFTRLNFRSQYESLYGDIFGSFRPVTRGSKKWIFTNANPCIVLYTKKIDTDDRDGVTGVSINNVPIYFRTALVAGMASYLTMNQKGSLQMKAYLERQFMDARYKAIATDLLAFGEGKARPGSFRGY